MSAIHKEEILEAYEDVRDDTTETMWLACKYEGNTIIMAAKGNDYDELLQHFGEDERAFAFVRIIMGDEMSKRAKFAFITWAGVNVGGMQRAKMSTAKSQVKSVITSFAAEITADHLKEVTLDIVRETLLKAGGANYGTGVAKN